MRTPSFRYMGGKARLCKWLVSHFPQSGRKYIEPFAGLGNVFYQARKDLNFQEWELSDLDVSFLRALLIENFDLLPAAVSREEFQQWARATGEQVGIARLIEPKITFAGKGYKHGFDGGHPSHPPYNGRLHRLLCEEARRLLQGVLVREMSWEAIDFDGLTAEDFVYLDPPYFGTKACYPQIDHERLVAVLNQAKFRWALSGYNCSLYESQLRFSGCYTRHRNSEIKSANNGCYSGVTEFLWTNFLDKPCGCASVGVQ